MNKTILKEKWKDIKGHEGFYQISNYGRVKSLRNNIILKLNDNKLGKGYMVVNLGRRKTSAKVHRLVAENFIPKIKGKTEVNHKDGDSKNNNVKNLEWVTRQENVLHQVYELGQHSGQYKMRPVNMLECKSNKIIRKFKSISEAIRWIKNNTKYKRASSTNISRVCDKKGFTMYGYKWEGENNE